jgi:hypothetical protein
MGRRLVGIEPRLCVDPHTSCGSPDRTCDIPHEPRDTSVNELFKIVERLVDDERTRGQGLETKTSTLAGFTGAILALTATLGRDLLKLDLGSVGDVAQGVLFALAIMALAAGSVIAVLGVLRPQQRLAIARSELHRFAEFPLIATPPIEIQGRMITTLVDALEHEREVNDRKAMLSRLAGLALAAGLVAVAGQAIATLASGS